MKARRRILLGIIFLVAGVTAFLYLVDRALRSRVGPAHAFQLLERPAFLTEPLALAKAQEALDLDGLDVARWHPVPDGRTAAPDGRPDEFMARNGLDPNRGVFLFKQGEREVRFVSVELHGDRVVCQTSAGK